MNRVVEGGSISVTLDETFVVERRSLAGSGMRTTIDAPDSVAHVGTRDPLPTSAFGGRPKIEESFRCTKRGTFEIRFVSGRPWQTATHTITTTVTCR